MKLIRIKVTAEDREILASMFDYAIYAVKQYAEFKPKKEHFEMLAEDFKDVRQRVIFEEMKE